jgi:hypothetical protein
MPQWRSLLVLAITAAACSRIMFAMIEDPEGPNLLVVTVMGAVIFLPSFALYRSKLVPSLTGLIRMAAAILIQIVIMTGFYFALR